MPLICAIVAYGHDPQGRLVIGKGNAIPWKIPKDMQYFKDKTMGSPVIMGRTTWESIPAKFRPLAGRANIVMTSSPDFEAPGGVLVARSIEQARSQAEASGSRQIFVIGGERVYREWLPHTQMIFATEIEGLHEGDAFFPSDFTRHMTRTHQTGPMTDNGHTFRHTTYMLVD